MKNLGILVVMTPKYLFRAVLANKIGHISSSNPQMLAYSANSATGKSENEQKAALTAKVYANFPRYSKISCYLFIYS